MARLLLPRQGGPIDTLRRCVRGTRIGRVSQRDGVSKRKSGYDAGTRRYSGSRRTGSRSLRAQNPGACAPPARAPGPLSARRVAGNRAHLLDLALLEIGLQGADGIALLLSSELGSVHGGLELLCRHRHSKEEYGRGIGQNRAPRSGLEGRTSPAKESARGRPTQLPWGADSLLCKSSAGPRDGPTGNPRAPPLCLGAVHTHFMPKNYPAIRDRGVLS